MTVREPEFSTADRVALIKSLTDSLRPRGRHGFLLSEATDPDLAFQWKVPPPRRDYAQRAIDAQQAAYEKQYKHDHPESLLWRVEKAD